MDIRKLEFDPDHFRRDDMHRKIQRWISTFGLPTTVKFYGFPSALERLRDRLHHYQQEHEITMSTTLTNDAPSGRRGMEVTFDRETDTLANNDRAVDRVSTGNTSDQQVGSKLDK